MEREYIAVYGNSIESNLIIKHFGFVNYVTLSEWLENDLCTCPY